MKSSTLTAMVLALAASGSGQVSAQEAPARPQVPARPQAPAQQDAPARSQPPAQEVKIEVMTCAQLKAEGQRQLAIMQNARYNDLDDDLSDEADMIRLGERQGRRSIALGAMQAAAGLAGNAAGVAQAGRAADMMTSVDKMDRDAILMRGHLRNKASERKENMAGEQFVALTEQYRRRGCRN